MSYSDQQDRGVGPKPVGSTRRGVNGLYDVGANVWEWVDGARVIKKYPPEEVGGMGLFGCIELTAQPNQEKQLSFILDYGAQKIWTRGQDWYPV